MTELSLAAFEEVICLAYARKHLLRGDLVEHAFGRIDFTESAARLTMDPGLGLLRKALTCFSVTFFGSQHHQNRITSKGYKQYGEVLQQLNHHLGQPKWQLTDETLLTASSCMLLEAFLPTGPANFLKHQRGIDALLEMRGPPTKANIGIFRGLRILSIVGALVDSRPSLFSREEWKQVPPSVTTEATKLQYLQWNVLADCTRLISQRDALLASGAGSEEMESLLVKIHDVVEDLRALYPLCEALNQSQFAAIKERSKMAKELGITNVTSVNAYILYNTAHICILQIKDSLFPSPENVTLRNAAASKIARYLEFREEERQKGAPRSDTIGLFTHKLVWQTLGRFDSPEGRKLAREVTSWVTGVFSPPCESTEYVPITSPIPNDSQYVTENAAADPINVLAMNQASQSFDCSPDVSESSAWDYQAPMYKSTRADSHHVI